MNWVAARYGAKTFGIGRQGGSAVIQVRGMHGQTVDDPEFRKLVMAMLNGLQLAEDERERTDA